MKETCWYIAEKECLRIMPTTWEITLVESYVSPASDLCITNLISNCLNSVCTI